MEINNENICGNIRVSKTNNDPRTPSKDSRTTVNKKPFDNNNAASTPKASSFGSSPSNKSFGGSLSARSIRDGVKNSKLQVSAELNQKVQMRKENWAREKELKARQNKLCREANAKRVQELCDAAAEARKHSAEKKKRMLDRQKKEEQDMLAASLLERAQLAADLDREAKARRRISIFLNKKMKESAKMKEREMQEEEKKREADLLASRRINFLAVREAKKAEEMRKRESLVSRGVKASFDRKVDEVIAQNEKILERDLIDFRLENRIDECNQKYVDKIRHRQSLENRLDVWRMQRTLEQEEQHQEQQNRIEESRVRQEDWQDIQRYKETQTKKERESLAGRLQKWKEEKEITQRLRTQEQEAEHIERELAQQELDDLHAYQEVLKRKRKQSLAYRLDKARKDQDFEKGQLALQQAYQEEELKMKTIDHEDVKKFREQLQAARRQSLQYRTQLAHQERMRVDGEKQAQHSEQVAEIEFRASVWADMKAYQEQQRIERRQSVAWRIAESRRQKEIDLGIHSEKMQALLDEIEHRRQVREDDIQFEQNEKQKRRMSVVLRLDSWRVQKMAEQKLKAKKLMIQEEEIMYAEMDREALQLSKEQMKLKLQEDSVNRAFV